MVRNQPVQTAGGRKEAWPVAEVRVAIDDREVTTPCFIAPGGLPLLGAVAIESLLLGVDPVAKRLVPVEGFIGSVPAAGTREMFPHRGPNGSRALSAGCQPEASPWQAGLTRARRRSTG